MIENSNLGLNEAMSLEQVSNINLLKIQLPDQRMIFLSDSFDMEYNGNFYKYLDFKIEGDLDSQTGEKSRPSVQVSNPEYMLNKLALSGDLIGSLVVRYQLETTFDTSAKTRLVKANSWRLYQIGDVSTTVTLQLRVLTDSALTKIPPRKYYPPTFSHVNV